MNSYTYHKTNQNNENNEHNEHNKNKEEKQDLFMMVLIQSMMFENIINYGYKVFQENLVLFICQMEYQKQNDYCI